MTACYALNCFHQHAAHFLAVEREAREVHTVHTVQ